MNHANIEIISSWDHCAQVVTGFLLLKKANKLTLSIAHNKEVQMATGNLAAVRVEYQGVNIIYDLMDGYQNPKGMQRLLDTCDVYYKRSFLDSRNIELFKEQSKKMHPLGFNYLVSCKGNPYNKGGYRELLLRVRGDKPKSYFTPEKFESIPAYKESGLKILFLTRLWDAHEPNAEKLNRSRIDLLRQLKKEYKESFVGGIRQSSTAVDLASDLVVSKRHTERSNYLKLLRESDICIGTLGLHESTGWKTAEYIAASKAIVNERLVYEVPGNFTNGVNYFDFTNEEECYRLIKTLLSQPELVFKMKKANQEYYEHYLRPDSLVLRTLDVI